MRRAVPSRALYTWTFAQDQVTMEVKVSGPLIADDRALIVAAALDGIGLAHIHEALVAEHIAQGTLVGVLESGALSLQIFFLY